jgi:hypothetical protein
LFTLLLAVAGYASAAETVVYTTYPDPPAPANSAGGWLIGADPTTKEVGIEVGILVVPQTARTVTRVEVVISRQRGGQPLKGTLVVGDGDAVGEVVDSYTFTTTAAAGIAALVSAPSTRRPMVSPAHHYFLILSAQDPANDTFFWYRRVNQPATITAYRTGGSGFWNVNPYASGSMLRVWGDESPAGVLTGRGTLAHVAAGSGWTTSIVLLSNASQSVRLQLNFWDDNGRPMPVDVAEPAGTGTERVTTFATGIEPGGVAAVTLQAPSLSVGSVEVLATAPVTGYAIFRMSTEGDRSIEGTAVLDTVSYGNLTLAYDNTIGFVTGLAIANPAMSSVDIRVAIADASGNVVRRDLIHVPGHGHMAMNVAEQYKEAQNRRGTITLSAAGSASALGLRFSSGGAFTSLPVFGY